MEWNVGQTSTSMSSPGNMRSGHFYPGQPTRKRARAHAETKLSAALLHPTTQNNSTHFLLSKLTFVSCLLAVLGFELRTQGLAYLPHEPSLQPSFLLVSDRV
jgi:hypothetical protein